MEQPGLTVPQALEKLLAEGDANQIAQYLEQEGITGLQHSPDRCIIAEYLRDRTGLFAITVGTSWLKLSKGTQANGTVTWRGPRCDRSYADVVELPEELDRLAHSFDRGDFPSLVRKAEQ